MSGRLHRRCAPQEEGKGLEVCVCPVHWRGSCIGRICLEILLAGRKIIWSRGEMRQLSQEGTSVCKTRKGLAGNQRMSKDWHWAVSRPFCRG